MHSKTEKSDFFRFIIRGRVQGVGFRPFVCNSCISAGITGYVQNIGGGAEAVVSDRKKFKEILKKPPSLARIDSYEVEKTSGTYKDFKILPSRESGKYSEIPADLFLCAACVQELRKKSDPRFNYFFITCTNCGPRYSIIEDTPYDRPKTSMNEFKMCGLCSKEYEDPKNRRYHAQTVACPICGPELRLLYKGRPFETTDPIAETASILKKGEVVAVKGIGGFHLMSLTDEKSVTKLRKINRRMCKPFAVMAKDLKMAEDFAEVSENDKQVLISKERPILVLPKKKPLSAVTELDTVGIMLPYTGLHYLLFDHISEPLVFTSSNLTDEPLTTEKSQQFVDYILDHDRRIVNRTDDSVLKPISGKILFIRRSRGYVPSPIPVQLEGTVLSLGAEMHNSITLLKDGQAFPSQYIGHISNPDAFESFKEIVRKYLQFFKTKPEKIVCDLHPNYNSTLFAEQLSQELELPLFKAQHHLAHTYSVALENSLDDFVGIAADGMGYGSDGTIWGGEVFENQKRIASLEPQLQLGGDSATQYPEKMLVSVLSNFMGQKEIERHTSFKPGELSLLLQQKEQKFNSPATTSTGRILDAASAFLGFCSYRDYEGRPAMVLEANSTNPYDLEPSYDKLDRRKILKTTPIFEFLVENQDKGKSRLGATVQQYLAEGFFKLAEGKKPIVFSGGCAYNKIMTEYLLGKGALINEKVPCGDGGISFGQLGLAQEAL